MATDWSMFKGRLNITAEAYKSKTTDLLMSLAVAAQTGYTIALDQYRLDVEQGHRAFDREPEHRAAELPLDDDAHDVA